MEVWAKLSPKAKAVAGALGYFMNGDGKCWPSRKKLAERAGLGRLYGVTKATHELHAKGLLCINRRQRGSCVYQWARPEGAQGEPSEPIPEGAQSEPSNALEGAQNEPSENLEGAQGAPFEGANSAPPPSPRSTPNSVCTEPASFEDASKKGTLRERVKQLLPIGRRLAKSYHKHIGRPGNGRKAEQEQAARNAARLLAKNDSLTEADLELCIANYAHECSQSATEGTYRKCVKNFFGQKAYWESYHGEDWKPPPSGNNGKPVGRVVTDEDTLSVYKNAGAK